MIMSSELYEFVIYFKASSILESVKYFGESSLLACLIFSSSTFTVLITSLGCFPGDGDDNGHNRYTYSPSLL